MRNKLDSLLFHKPYKPCHAIEAMPCYISHAIEAMPYKICQAINNRAAFPYAELRLSAEMELSGGKPPGRFEIFNWTKERPGTMA